MVKFFSMIVSPSILMGKFMSRNLFKADGLQLVAFILLVASVESVFSDTAVPSAASNYCLDGSFHKNEPSPEAELYGQCSPWKNRSCCHNETSYNAHHTNMYRFSFDHCGKVQNMSESCRKHFRQDLCFYECSPNVGNWVVKVEMKIRKERFLDVPLCRSECDAWFKACQNDYTCADDWVKKFKWTKDGNQCVDGSKCLTIKEVFGNAKDFCEKVWNHSWKVLPDNQPCMKIWFNGTSGNPNDEVAAYYANHDDSSVGRLDASMIFILSIISIHQFA